MRVLCDSKECLWWKSLPEEEFVEHHKAYVPLKGMGFPGECTREKEIGIRFEEVRKNRGHLEIVLKHPFCTCFSDTKIHGHIDFASLLQSDGTPKGERLDEKESKRMSHEQGKLHRGEHIFY